MIELDEHEGSYLAICKHYRAVFETPEVKENPEKAKEVRIQEFYMLNVKYNMLNS